MFWVLILLFWKIIEPLKNFFGSYVETITYLNQCSKGNVSFSLLNSSNMDIRIVETLELGQVFLYSKFLYSFGKPTQ